MPIDTGDTAWVLVSTAMVMLMTPGLALFYGGMTGARGVLNMVMMSFACLGVVSLLWVLFGYSLAFTGTNPLVGGLGAVGLRGVDGGTTGTVPTLAFAAFQLMFAVITPALVSGAIAERARFAAWIVFAAVWTTLVYFPVAHWVFYSNGGHGGWIVDHLGAVDFAGGTAVHVNAGAAALALALVLGRRRGWPHRTARPHNVPLVLLGAGLLWFGWFGFNAGSALTAGGTASLAALNTQVATAAAAMAWIAVEWLRVGRATPIGLASGAVAGLVAITPACAAVGPIGALAIGIVAGAVCSAAVGWKLRARIDDSLDVVGVHLFGGLVGTLLIGVFGAAAFAGGPSGLLDGGGLVLLGKQAVAALAVAGYSFVVAWLIGKAIDKTIGFRIDPDAEDLGIDLAEHDEFAYDADVAELPAPQVSSASA